MSPRSCSPHCSRVRAGSFFAVAILIARHLEKKPASVLTPAGYTFILYYTLLGLAGPEMTEVDRLA